MSEPLSSRQFTPDRATECLRLAKGLGIGTDVNAMAIVQTEKLGTAGRTQQNSTEEEEEMYQSSLHDPHPHDVGSGRGVIFPTILLQYRLPFVPLPSTGSSYKVLVSINFRVRFCSRLSVSDETSHLYDSRENETV